VAVERGGRALRRLWMGWSELKRHAAGTRMPSRTRLASSRWGRLHGDRVTALWAMPMKGLPDCSSARVRPKFK